MLKLLFYFLILAIVPIGALAMSSASYKIDADVISGGGAYSSATNYKLTDTVGEAVTGISSGGPYQSKAGFWYMVNYSILLELNGATKSLGILTPGTPVIAETVATVTTDAWNGYTLGVNQGGNMLHTDTVTEIPPYSCEIADPCVWSGVGLGFTITDGTDVEAKWGTDPNYEYAAFPLVATTIHQKENYYSGGDDTAIEYKLDVDGDQKSGAYSNLITYTATTSL